MSPTPYISEITLQIIIASKCTGEGEMVEERKEETERESGGIERGPLQPLPLTR